MKLRKTFICLTAVFLSLLLTACGEEGEPDTRPVRETVQETESPVPPATEAAFSFTDVADLEFRFSSGAGGWRTVLYIHEDGSFDGQFQDSNMGDAGEGYPRGSVSCSKFAGRFSTPEKVNDTTWLLPIEDFTDERDRGEEIRDGVRYTYSAAYGLGDAGELYLYLPGMALEALPQEYRDWVGYHDLTYVKEKELTFYGLYNETERTGFSSHQAVSLFDRASEMIEATAACAAQLEEEARTTEMNQSEMNMNAEERYRQWDMALNSLWRLLKENLDEETMGPLTEEQLDWIKGKETAAEAAADEVGGGSLAPVYYYGKAAELTRERVYVLLEYLK